MDQWHKNTGVMPVEPEVLVDVRFNNGRVIEGQPAGIWRWNTPSGSEEEPFLIDEWHVAELLPEPEPEPEGEQ